MKVHYRVLFVFSAILYVRISAEEMCQKRSDQVLLDLLIEDFTSETWEHNESNCQRQMLEILINTRNTTLWSTWIWDSMQLPTGVFYGSRYQLGNFDQCLKAPWSSRQPVRTQYCLAEVQLTNDVPDKGNPEDMEIFNSAEEYVNTLTRFSQELNKMTWGLCVPASCGPKSLPKLTKMILRHSHLGRLTPDPLITISSCQESIVPARYPKGLMSFVTLMSVLCMVAVFSTFYVWNAKSYAPSLIKCFDMDKNTQDLVKTSPDDLKSLHGLRTMSSHIVVGLHWCMYGNSLPVSNELGLEKTMDSVLGVVGHMDLVTDTFFMMSGLLLMRGFMTKWESPENPLVVILKRYIRLVAPYAVIMLYIITTSDCGTDGPLWPTYAGRDQAACANNWWQGLLMIHNYVNSYRMCHVVTWYIASDFHFTIVGTALFYVFRRNKCAGITLFSVAGVLSVVLSAYVTYANQLNAVPIMDMYLKAAVMNRDPGDRIGNDLGLRYIKSHCRLGSYLVGLAFGYLTALYKPENHRGAFPKIHSLLISSASSALALACLLLGASFYHRKYDLLEAIIFASTNRIVWAIAMGGIVLVCEYGSLPLMKSFLEWRAFAPFSRLSYGLYLIHTLIIQRRVYSLRTPYYRDIIGLLTDCCGVIALGTLFSFILWLLVEAPVTNLTNLIIRSPKIPKFLHKDEQSTVRKSSLNGHSTQYIDKK